MKENTLQKEFRFGVVETQISDIALDMSEADLEVRQTTA